MFFNRDHVKKGDEHYRKGSLSKAAEHYLKAKRFRQAAEIYEELGEVGKAAEIYDKRGFPLDAARLLAADGELKRAISLFEKGGDFRQAAEASLKLRSFVRAGRLFEKAEMFVRAAECFDQGHEIEFVARALEKEKERLRARRREQPDPDPGLDRRIREADLRRAEILATLGRHLESAELYAEHGEDERSAPLFVRAERPALAAQAYLAAGRFDEALRALEDAGDGEDELRAEIYLNCARHADAARLFEDMGRFDAAASAWEGDEAWSEAAALWEKAGSLGRAAELYLQLNRNADAGRCLAGDGQPERAALAFRKSGMHQDAAAAYREAGRLLKAGELYLQAGDADAAREALEEVDEDHRDYGPASLLLIPILAEQGSLDGARRRWRAIEKKKLPVPSSERIYVEARLCEAGGRYQQAETLYRKVLAEDHSFRDAAARLRDVRGKVSFSAEDLGPAAAEEEAPEAPPAAPPPPSEPLSGSFSALPSLIAKADLPFEIRGPIEPWWQGAAFFRARDKRNDGEVMLVSFPLAVVGGREDGFRQAMKEVAAVRHPAILRLQEANLASDKVLLLYEPFDGETLSRRTEPATPSAASSLIVQLCEALAAAHKLGVTHQWISPRTVLTDDDDHVKIVGLGLREVLAERDDTSRAYLSPEVRDDGIVGPASDVFSLGLLALDLLRIELPATAADRKSLTADKVDWPPEVEENFPASVRELLIRTISDEPSARPSTEELRVALTALGLVPGQVLSDRYEIRDLLGSGGMSRVYRARDRDLGEDVAIKVLHSSAIHSEDEERLLREVRICRRISHPNVVRVHDLGRFVGGFFVTMELLDGSGLDEVIRSEAPLGLRRVKKLLIEIAEALIEAHRLKIIHRDLKPSNVMLCDGRVKVVDFGIARTTDGSAGDVTRTGEVFGSPMYMAPEQIQGRPLTGSADIYALGVIAYTLLGGKEPFTGETATAIALKHLHEPPPDIRGLRPELPEPWIELIEGMLEKTPEDRPGSARELADRLAEMPESDTDRS